MRWFPKPIGKISNFFDQGEKYSAIAPLLAAVSFGENIVKATEWGRVSEAQAQVARAFGGLAGAIFTGKPGGVYSRADAAETTFRYNYLSHHQDELKNKELAADSTVVLPD